MSEYAKGERPREQEDRAKGGAVLGRVRDFMKEEDQFRAEYHGDKQGPGDRTGDITASDNKYAKSGEGAGNGMCGGAPPARGKELKPIKPRT